jgi:hypothetical protein
MKARAQLRLFKAGLCFSHCGDLSKESSISVVIQAPPNLNTTRIQKVVGSDGMQRNNRDQKQNADTADYHPTRTCGNNVLPGFSELL